MLSTPPAMIRLSQPARTFCEAMFTAFQRGGAEAVDLGTGDGVGKPEAIAAVLAMSAPWSPTGVTQAGDDVVDRVGVELGVSVAQFADESGQQGDRLDADAGNRWPSHAPRGVRIAS